MSVTTSSDLVSLCENLKLPLVFIGFKDQLPTKKVDGLYIVNMQNKNDGDGTHWVCFIIDHNKAAYFDSFGMVAPKSIHKYLNKFDAYFNSIQLQNINATYCGWIVIAFAHFMYTDKTVDYKKKIQKFCKLFDNGKVYVTLEKYFRKLL